jgi:copper(I)-binding protein
MKKIIAIFAILFATLSVSGCAPEVTNELPKTGIIIENAIVTVGETEARVYATITSRANGTVTLTGGTTDVAGTVKVMKGGGSSEKLLKDGVDIHVGQELILDEALTHLTLTKLTKPILFGDKISFTFEFEGAEPQTIELTAKREF